MSRPCKASSPSLLLALTLACGGDDGSSADTSAADTSATPATTTGAPITGESGESGTPTTTAATSTDPSTDTGDPPGTTTDGSSTGADACQDSIVTWENFGESFFLTWCTGCHHSALPSAERACAPCGANFDSHAGAGERAAIIKLRVLDYMTVDGLTPMPPAAILPEEELALLREWIDCGAPGPQTGQSGELCPDPGAPVDGC